MCDEFKSMGYRVVSNGTDNHLILLDVKSSVNITGLVAEKALDEVNITVNKNTIPRETEKSYITSGIRIGSPAMTTRGLNEEDFREIARIIDSTFKNLDNEEEKELIRKRVKDITSKYPLWY